MYGCSCVAKFNQTQIVFKDTPYILYMLCMYDIYVIYMLNDSLYIYSTTTYKFNNLKYNFKYKLYIVDVCNIFLFAFRHICIEMTCTCSIILQYICSTNFTINGQRNLRKKVNLVCTFKARPAAWS